MKKFKLKFLSILSISIIIFSSISNPAYAIDVAGDLDHTFTTNLGTGFNGDIFAIAVQSDGKIVVGGNFTTQNGVSSKGIARINTDGTPDTTFRTNIGTGFGVGGTVESLAIQSDGKIVVGGIFFTQNGVTANSIARFNSDGTPDTTFRTNSGTGFFNNEVLALAIQSDGKIVAGGSFVTQNGVSANRIARINTDGTPDATFRTNIGTGFNDGVSSIRVHALAIQSNGKIVAGGSFNDLNGSYVDYVARLNSNGTPDTTFRAGLDPGQSDTTGLDSTVYTLAVQSDGQIVVGGGFTTYNGGPGSNGFYANYIARLDPDDAYTIPVFSTNIGSGFDNLVKSLLIQSNGKIVVGGDFTTQDGVSSNYIARQNSDGTPDTTFRTNIGTGFNGTVNALAIQSDGKIIVGGSFTSINGTTSNYIARLMTNTAPIASSVSITGTLNISQLLTGQYTYTDADNDAEGASTFRWLRDDVAIGSATSSTYTTVQADIGHTIKFEVTPVASAGTTLGTAVASSGSAITLATPTVTTGTSTSVTTTTVTLGGNITATGGEDATSRGIYYGLNNSYDSNVTESSTTYSTGTYTEPITGLTCGTLYHYKAFAVNTAGTGLGSDSTFTTSDCPVTRQYGSSLPQYRYNVIQVVTPTQNTILSLTLTFTKTIRIGDRSSNTLETQNFLNTQGNNLVKDGIFGKLTKFALIKYQNENGLNPDGILGPKTRAVINGLNK